MRKRPRDISEKPRHGRFTAKGAWWVPKCPQHECNTGQCTRSSTCISSIACLPAQPTFNLLSMLKVFFSLLIACHWLGPITINCPALLRLLCRC